VLSFKIEQVRHRTPSGSDAQTTGRARLCTVIWTAKELAFRIATR
jgi:hypothetical protein